jgi:hypothetical protein
MPERGPEGERAATAKAVRRGTIGEAFGGAIGVVLAILGLAGVLPEYMAAIASIAIGAALLAQGGALAARWSHLHSEAAGIETAEIGTGMSAELFGGAVGVALGVLALVGVAPQYLLPIALIVFGGTLLLGTATEADLAQLARPNALEAGKAKLVREATVAASGTQLLVGIAAVVLGIVGLVGPARLLVTLVGMLVVGGSILLTGATLGGRMMMVMRR